MHELLALNVVEGDTHVWLREVEHIADDVIVLRFRRIGTTLAVTNEQG